MTDADPNSDDEEVPSAVTEINEVAEPCVEAEPSIGLPLELRDDVEVDEEKGDDEESNTDVSEAVSDIQEVAEPAHEATPSIGLPHELQEGDGNE